MREETLQEKAFHDLLSSEIGKQAQVMFSYQEKLRLIQGYLQHFYRERADWNRCVRRYCSEWAHQKRNGVILSADEMPVLSFSDLQRWLEEAQATQQRLHQIDDILQAMPEQDTPEKKERLLQAAALLGICPDQTDRDIFYWLIDREGMTETEKKQAALRISRDEGILDLTVKLMSDLFVSGMQMTFPHVGTVMIQRGGRYFFRGENAVYPSSKPGIFRTSDTRSLQYLKDSLILEEACYFLDQFDAVQRWAPSGVNYYALAQHYGIKTPIMDITSDLKTALFFACCQYENGRWRPLLRKDFAARHARPGTGDSRFGVIYRSPAELSDMKWALADDMAGWRLITPIGYQPFMRCSVQHGSMFLVENERYDMQKDPLFEKYRIELSEELCRWIFGEMDEGKKIFPHDDIPDIEQYMDRIRRTRVISRQTFDRFTADRMHLSAQQSARLEQELRQDGFSVANGKLEWIRHNRLQKINKRYSIRSVADKLKEIPKSRPLLILPSDAESAREEEGAGIRVP